MEILQIVLDTSSLVSALRSRRGAASLLLSLIDSGHFELNISVPLMLEYEAVCKRLVGEIPLTAEEIDDILNFICHIANRRAVFYLWRPLLADPKDDMVLEVAVAAGCDYIVTFNGRHFHGAERFGIKVRTPREFLQEIGVLP